MASPFFQRMQEDILDTGNFPIQNPTDDERSHNTYELTIAESSATVLQPTRILCQQCRMMDLVNPVRKIYKSTITELVANRTGLDPKCALCQLFAEALFPESCNEMFQSNELWQLSVTKSQHYGSYKQARFMFSPHQVVIFHTGNSTSDFIQYADDVKDNLRRYLAYMMPRELSRLSAEDPEAASWISEGDKSLVTQFIPQKYNPLLVKKWLDLSRQNNTSRNNGSTFERPRFTEQRHCRKLACRSEHQNGSKEIELMRVIDCKALEIVERTNDMRYVALSYVWELANKDMVSLRLHNRLPSTSSYNAISPTEVPRVVHDAITVVKDIGYQYLWVEVLCIDQSSKHDKEKIVSKMDLIYSSADLTIIAASSQGALPGVGGIPRIKQDVLELNSFEQGKGGTRNDEVIIFTSPINIVKHIQASSWYSRGWCFQEAILSSRRLYFTDHEMLFEGMMTSRTDSLPMMGEVLADPVYDGSRSLSSPLSWIERLQRLRPGDGYIPYNLDDPYDRFWAESRLLHKLLEIYTSKHLTMDSDALDGFQGAMKVFSRADPSFCTFQGLPVWHISYQLLLSRSKSQKANIYKLEKRTLIWALCWVHFNPIGFSMEIDNRYVRRIEFPSWSWAGWKNKIYFSLFSLFPAFSRWRHIMEIHAIEGRSGRVVDWPEAPSYFAGGSDAPLFLIGEAYMLPIDVMGQELDSWNLDVRENLDNGTWACLVLGKELLCEFDVKRLRGLSTYNSWFIPPDRREDRTPTECCLNLLVVSWEKHGNAKYYKGRRLRDCSLSIVGSVEHAFYPFDDGYKLFNGNHRALRRVHFRLG
ncbi:heterokaryon incompatibility protein-domain-containing protein [Whalleya microplaca]|nr:heterokaryon incompatibility protein-domain-containing protein [Whalleya microplaca]